MTAGYTSGGGNATLSFTYTAVKAKIDFNIENAAHYYWLGGWGDHGTEEAPKTWADITSTQKLAILDTVIKAEFQRVAKEYYINSTTEVTHTQAMLDANNSSTF